ncbi:MAG: class I SAM-dependent methyltransferase [Chloroflexi bacterium]|nr:MAG: class I SAM-dependent methyltransferase [Chloroflexota bacterium]
MSNPPLYASKAAYYARYRWDYAPDAIAALFAAVGLSNQTVVADLGAGTGILTQHFVGKTKMVYALEPEAEMRAQLEKALGGNPTCQIVNRRAENTGLPDHSIDLITVGQAIHWFEPQPARTEFLRILKPAGWLALLRNYGTDDVYEKAVAPLYRNFSASGLYDRVVRSSADFYFGKDRFQTLCFPFEFSLDWESFLGALLSSAMTPNEASPDFGEFVAQARQIFDRLAQNGRVVSTGETGLILGRIGK